MRLLRRLFQLPTGHILPNGEDRVAALRRATHASRAHILPGEEPYAAPMRWLNQAATRSEDFWLFPKRDGVRRLDETDGKPHWEALGPRIHLPLRHAAAVAHPGSVWRHVLATYAQLGVDVCVGACAVALACGYLCRGQAHLAKQTLIDHRIHLVSLVMAAGVAAGLALGISLA